MRMKIVGLHRCHYLLDRRFHHHSRGYRTRHHAAEIGRMACASSAGSFAAKRLAVRLKMKKARYYPAQCEQL